MQKIKTNFIIVPEKNILIIWNFQLSPKKKLAEKSRPEKNWQKKGGKIKQLKSCLKSRPKKSCQKKWRLKKCRLNKIRPKKGRQKIKAKKTLWQIMAKFKDSLPFQTLIVENASLCSAAICCARPLFQWYLGRHMLHRHSKVYI